MRCPTFTFKNRSTGEVVVINQSDYNQERYKYITNLGPLNSWSRISSSNGGGDQGYQKSLDNTNVAIGVKHRRSIDNLGQKIKFSSI